MRLLFLVSFLVVTWGVTQVASKECSAENYNCPESAPCCSKFGYCGTKEHCLPGICVAGCHLSPLKESKSISKSKTEYEFEKIYELEESGVLHRCVDPKHAALTYDDGIDPVKTVRLLDILKKEKVTASFFILGQSISRFLDLEGKVPNPDYKENRKIMKRMYEEGHEIGSHTFDHVNLTTLSRKQMEQQMELPSNLFERVIGRRPKFARAPEGKLSDMVVKAFRKRGDYLIHWNFNPEDWIYHEEDPNHMLRFTKEELPKAKRGEGPIILQHDIIERTIEIQVEMIRTIKKKGYIIVPLSKCLGIRPYHK